MNFFNPSLIPPLYLDIVSYMDISSSPFIDTRSLY